MNKRYLPAIIIAGVIALVAIPVIFLVVPPGTLPGTSDGTVDPLSIPPDVAVTDPVTGDEGVVMPALEQVVSYSFSPVLPGVEHVDGTAVYTASEPSPRDTVLAVLDKPVILPASRDFSTSEIHVISFWVKWIDPVDWLSSFEVKFKDASGSRVFSLWGSYYGMVFQDAAGTIRSGGSTAGFETGWHHVTITRPTTGSIVYAMQVDGVEKISSIGFIDADIHNIELIPLVEEDCEFLLDDIVVEVA